jgi:hypothetical protein
MKGSLGSLGGSPSSAQRPALQRSKTRGTLRARQGSRPARPQHTPSPGVGGHSAQIYRNAPRGPTQKSKENTEMALKFKQTPAKFEGMSLRYKKMSLKLGERSLKCRSPNRVLRTG